jgi:molybdopterin/thiamine biosynthesis adenylyltransferase
VSINLRQPLIPQAEHWPPENVKDIARCIEASDDHGLLKISKILHESIFKKTKENKKRNSGKIGIVLNWPGSNGILGLGAAFSFLLDSAIKTACEQGRLKGISGILKISLIKVRRYNLSRADAKYLHTRNEASQELYLHNKKILIVGAGSIGGYLSHIVCGMGGGSGNKGNVQLIDFDVFKPENVGRHFLGIESLGCRKVDAMSKRLIAAYPHLNIEPIFGSILDKPKLLESPDVIINATGSQTVSIGIEYFLSKINKNNPPPVIHSWLQGQGLASVILINDHKKKACFRCLWKLDNHDTYTSRYPIAKNSADEDLIFAGCHQSYHPYAATAAITAASDAANALKDLMLRGYKNTLRFNFIQPEKCQNRPDANPEKSDDCPICSASNSNA